MLVSYMRGREATRKRHTLRQVIRYKFQTAVCYYSTDGQMASVSQGAAMLRQGQRRRRPLDNNKLLCFQ